MLPEFEWYHSKLPLSILSVCQSAHYTLDARETTTQMSSASISNGSPSKRVVESTSGSDNDSKIKKSSYYRLIVLLLSAALIELAVSEYLLMLDQFSYLKNGSRRDTPTYKRFVKTFMQFKKKRHFLNDLKAASGTSISTAVTIPVKNRTIAYLLENVGLEATPDLIEQFPPMKEISALYGDDVIIPGLLETCEVYRNAVALEDRHTGPAGMFNSGTNLLYTLLMENCQLPNKRFGIVWQVPWGKHTPLSWKHRNFPKHWLSVEHDDVLPVVVIKDPYTWLRSMCRQSYNAHWPRNPDHCPNLIKTEMDAHLKEFQGMTMGEPVPVYIKYNQSHYTNHTNLIALWNDWYGAYWNDPGPRLFVRYEDMLFRPYETTSKLCTCIGGNFTYQGTFKYVKRSAKGERGSHQGSSDLISALLRYSNSTERIHGFSTEDMKVAAAGLNKVLLDTFHYPMPLNPI